MYIHVYVYVYIYICIYTCIHTHTYTHTQTHRWTHKETIVDIGLPWGSDGKASACNAGDLGSIPGLGRSPVEGNGNPLQYSCLENSIDEGGW